MAKPSAIRARYRMPIESEGITHVSNARVSCNADHVKIRLGMAEVVVDAKLRNGNVLVIVGLEVDRADHVLRKKGM
jgi:hypothetical protein